MTEREKFEAWWYGGADEINQSRNSAYAGWQACANKKDSKIAELKVEIESLHDRLAAVIGQREELK